MLTKKQLLQVEEWQNEMLFTKARIGLVKDGEHNFKYCHASIKERRIRKWSKFKNQTAKSLFVLRKLGCWGKTFFPWLFSAGNPLSPLLCFDSVILSFNLWKHIRGHMIKPYRAGRYDYTISHLLYADDIFLFTNGS